MNLKPNVLIFSVFQKHISDKTNRMAHAEVLNILKSEGLPVMELQGKYNGSEELSILVEGFQHRVTVERLCKVWNQECYLESHNDRFTNLIYTNGSVQPIGTLTAVSKEEAEAVGSYSYNPVVGQYFVTR